MDEKRISFITDCLTAYAVERQNGWERHQPEDAPPWAEQRRFWTDAILQGMARLEGLTPDPDLMKRFDQQLDAARSASAVDMLPQEAQTALVCDLRRYVSALEATGDDRRRQVAVVQNLLEDMYLHQPWDAGAIGLFQAHEEAERALLRMTARMPIRFTRILLGGDAGPNWVSGFVSGVVQDVDSVQGSGVYAQALQDYPEVNGWPALCTVYVGRGLPSARGAVDASEFDLAIMNRAGDRFLKEQGIRPISASELYVPACEQIRALKVEPGRTPELVLLPNTTDALQAAVGGDIELLDLDGDACLVCNENGKVCGLPANRQVGRDIIAGTFLVVSAYGGMLHSLSDADAERYAEEFMQPMQSQSEPDEPTQWIFRVY